MQRDYMKWAYIGLLAFPTMGACYIFGFWYSLGGNSSLLFSLGFPPALLLSLTAYAHYLSRGGSKSPMVEIGFVFSALAAATFLMMVTIQSGIRAEFLEEYQMMEQGDPKEAALWTLKIADQIQLSIDIAWDVWISLAAAAFGIAMTHRLNTGFERAVGVIGVIAGLSGLAVNLYAFPVPPTKIGLPDPGLFFFVWFSLVAVSYLSAVIQGPKKMLARLPAS